MMIKPDSKTVNLRLIFSCRSRTSEGSVSVDSRPDDIVKFYFEFAEVATAETRAERKAEEMITSGYLLSHVNGWYSMDYELNLSEVVTSSGIVLVGIGVEVAAAVTDFLEDTW
jgi:hypothetical protein